MQGEICLDILKVRPIVPRRLRRTRSRVWCLQEKWSAVYSVQTVLVSLQSLLGGEPSRFETRSINLTSIRDRAEQRIATKRRSRGALGKSAEWVISTTFYSELL